VTVFTDTFTEGSNTDLSAHTPDSGGTWSVLVNTTSTGPTGDALGVLASTDVATGLVGEGSTNIIYTVSWTPAGADYDVTGDVSALRNSANSNMAVLGRIADADNYYAAVINDDNANPDLRILAMVGGSLSTPASANLGTTAPATILFSLRSATSRQEIFLNGSGTAALSADDTNLTAAGLVGIGQGNFGATGTHEVASASITRITLDDSASSGGTTFQATGDLDAQAATVSGTALHHRVGSGALAAQSAAVAGAGVVRRTATGTLAAQAAALSGDGVARRTATGTLAAVNATIEGAASVIRAATGALSAEAAVLAGTAIVIRVATGALDAEDATISGEGENSAAPEDSEPDAGGHPLSNLLRLNLVRS